MKNQRKKKKRLLLIIGRYIKNSKKSKMEQYSSLKFLDQPKQRDSALVFSGAARNTRFRDGPLERPKSCINSIKVAKTQIQKRISDAEQRYSKNLMQKYAIAQTHPLTTPASKNTLNLNVESQTTSNQPVHVASSNLSKTSKFPSRGEITTKYCISTLMQRATLSASTSKIQQPHTQTSAKNHSDSQYQFEVVAINKLVNNVNKAVNQQNASKPSRNTMGHKDDSDIQGVEVLKLLETSNTTSNLIGSGKPEHFVPWKYQIHQKVYNKAEASKQASKMRRVPTSRKNQIAKIYTNKTITTAKTHETAKADHTLTNSNKGKELSLQIEGWNNSHDSICFQELF